MPMNWWSKSMPTISGPNNDRRRLPELMDDNPYQPPRVPEPQTLPRDTRSVLGAARRGFSIGATIGISLSAVFVVLQVGMSAFFYWHFGRLPEEIDAWTIVKLPLGVAYTTVFVGIIGMVIMVLATRIAGWFGVATADEPNQ